MKRKKNKYKKKFNEYQLINNPVNMTDVLIKIGTTSKFVTLSHTGVGNIVVPIAAGASCATGKLVRM